MKMRVKGIIIIGLMGIALVCLVDSVEASIDDVTLFPEEPTINDPITIIASGMESCGPVTIINSDFQIDGNFLELNISLDVGPYTVVTPWSHSEPVGTLPAGLYDITVRTLEDAIVTDTYSASFEVVPEPSSLLLMAGGLTGLLLRDRKNVDKEDCVRYNDFTIWGERKLF